MYIKGRGIARGVSDGVKCDIYRTVHCQHGRQPDSALLCWGSRKHRDSSRPSSSPPQRIQKHQLHNVVTSPSARHLSELTAVMQEQRTCMEFEAGTEVLRRVRIRVPWPGLACRVCIPQGWREEVVRNHGDELEVKEWISLFHGWMQRAGRMLWYRR